jgi:hypothetical protein
MIRQFSRKIEKQEILNLKNKKNVESSLGNSRLQEGYKPGLLERNFDLLPPLVSLDRRQSREMESATSHSALAEVTENFEGKMDKSLYYSKQDKAKGQSRSRSWSWSNYHKISGNRFSKPDLIFAIGISELDQPLREANNAGIPIIAVTDSDQNPFLKGRIIDYIIPGNDDSIRSYAFFCMMISQAVQEGQSLNKRR